MKKLLSRWIAAIMVSVMVISSGVTGTVQAEENHVETTEEKLQTDTEKNNSEIEGDLSVGDDATSQKEDDSMTEENSVTESEVIKEGAVNEENVGKNPESTEVSEETEPEESEEIEMALNYLYINEAEQQEGEQQSIVLSWGNENTQVNNISLTLENENGEQTILEATKKSDELYLYEHIFSQGVYHVSNVHVATDESEKDFTAEELEIDAYFGVGKTPNESAKSSYIEMESVEEGEDSANTAASVETSVVSIGENGEETAEASIGAAMEAQGVTARSGKARSARAKNVVVVLDPGHDSKHAGASGNSVHEEVATLKIAKYCKEELEQYGGITVYMTRESAACPFPNSKDNIDDIKQRTAWAKTKGADVFVSFHLNSNNSSSPNGAEVYYPKTSSGGAALAQKIQGELVALGLKNRGTKANETLAVINSSMRNGFPGVLIEHAFVSNSSDANNYLNSDAKLKKLGVADAKGIASYFGLSKAGIRLDAEFHKMLSGEIYQFLATPYGMSGIPKATSNNTKVATVKLKNAADSRGVLFEVQGIDPGKATISVELGGCTASIQIEVSNEFELDETDITIEESNVYQFLALIQNKNDGEPKIYSTDANIASVKLKSDKDSRGYLYEIKAENPGETTIVVEYKGVIRTVNVTVKKLITRLSLDTESYQGTAGMKYQFLVFTNNKKEMPKVTVEDESVTKVELKDANDPRGIKYEIQGLKAGDTRIKVELDDKIVYLPVKYIKPEYKLDTSGEILEKGKIFQFLALINNKEGVSPLVSSSNPKVASVKLINEKDSRGYMYQVDAIGTGTATITTDYYGTKKSFVVNVIKPDIKLSLDTTSYSGTAGEVYQFLIYTNDREAIEEVKSSNPEVTEVKLKDEDDPRGIKYEIQGLKAGNSTISVTAGGKTVSFVATYKAVDYALDTTTWQMNEGEIYQFLALIKNKTNKEAPKVSTSNSKVASVKLINEKDSRGYMYQVDAIGTGTATITTDYYGTKKSFVVNVIKPGIKLSLDTTSYSGTAGEVYQFLIYTNDREAIEEVKSSNPEVTEVKLKDADDPRGIKYEIQGLKAGNSTISVTAGGKTVSFVATYKAVDYALDTTTWQMNEGEVYQFLALIKDKTNKESPKVWSSDESKAKVYVKNLNDSRGYLYEVKALEKGYVTIYTEFYGTRKSFIIKIGSLYEISGQTLFSAMDLQKFYLSKLPIGITYPEFYKNSDAPTLSDFCRIYYEEAVAENIKPEVAFCQAMLETNWLRYTGDVKIDQYNFAGIGATGGGNPGNKFTSVREGIRAQIQHLKCFANNEALVNPCVDPRWGNWLRGKAPYVEWLGKQENPFGTGWATGKGYGYNIVNMIYSIK